MKILLIGNYQPDAIISMEIFLNVLATTLPKFGHQVRVLRPQPYLGSFQSTLKPIQKWLGYIDKIVLFPSQLYQALSWPDIVHICDHGNAIYTQYLQHIPHVVTCHDLLAIRSGFGEFPEYKTRWTGKKLQQMILKGLNQAQSVVCVSQKTQSDLLRLCSIKPEAVSLIYQGLNYPYSPMQSSQVEYYLERLGIPKNTQYILHVGANHWYKNRLGVLSIFEKLLPQYKLSKLHLVMVGKPFTPEMREFIKTHNLSQNIIELVDINPEDLRAIYSGAIALVFPSLQEGFGWPIIEAQACGCPVFTSNRPPLNEIGGQAAIYIDPTHHQQAARTNYFSST
ncbi:glycosyltransferase family 4 protein [Capilliphycus salinus ALCB114379]|uniref:glycosyltransferase family 4 protein n=1 Tax=Capilliphycus salinus TaxID=2768948 RepID=UPI0039A55B86